MEPRPPRLSSRHPLDRPSSPAAEPHPTPQFAPTPGPVPVDDARARARTETVGPASAGPQPTISTAGAFPPFGQDQLVPSRTRRRRALARGVLALLVVLVGLGTVGAVYGERVADWAGDQVDQRLGGDDGDEDASRGQAQILTPPATSAPLAGAASPTAVPPPRASSPVSTVASPSPSPSRSAVASPTPRPSRAAGSRTPTPQSAQRPAPLADMLPTVEDLPENLLAGFVVTQDDERTLDQVAASLGDPAETTPLLEEWGWRQNLFRTFENPGAEIPEDATNYVDVSLHRFGNAESTGEALDYFSDAVVAAQGLSEIRVDRVGDEVRALSGNPEGTANLVVLYVRDGPTLIRIGGSSPAGDPTEDVLALAREVVER